MDAAAFEQVYQDFHAYIAGLLGRRETRAQGSQSTSPAGAIRGAAQRREFIGDGSRVGPGMQRFLTDSPWDDDAAIGRRSTWRPNRSTLGRCGCWTAATIPSQGVARQYCGRLGQVANCQVGMFLACVSPLGRALVD